LLLFLAVRSYLGRETAEPPRWMGALQNADPRRAFITGLCSPNGAETGTEESPRTGYLLGSEKANARK
jgi:hypothetical protein